MEHSSSKPIHIFSLGGTFEKVYGVGNGVSDLSFPDETAVADIVARFGVVDVHVFYTQGIAKDSLHMNDADRESVAEWCVTTDSDTIVIVHGTDTMVETAHVVFEKCSDKTIVFTGAMQPAAMKQSDAEFNLGGAIVAAQTLSSGVFIVMNGKVFSHDVCRKNPETGVFEGV